MLKIENVEVLGWEHAIRGMRNPKNSWAKSDSGPECPFELYSALVCAPARDGKPQWTPMMHLLSTIAALNYYREKYIDTKDKQNWWQMIQLLPISYNQRRTVMLNYEVLANMYKSRRNHKLDEWHTFCDWIESLPYSELITGKQAV